MTFGSALTLGSGAVLGLAFLAASGWVLAGWGLAAGFVPFAFAVRAARSAAGLPVLAGGFLVVGFAGAALAVAGAVPGWAGAWSRSEWSFRAPRVLGLAHRAR